MADFASRSFHTHPDHAIFSDFHTCFLLPQEALMDHVPTSKQAAWKSLFNSVNQDTNVGLLHQLM